MSCLFTLKLTGGLVPGINGMAGSPGPGNPYGLQVKIFFILFFSFSISGVKTLSSCIQSLLCHTLNFGFPSARTVYCHCGEVLKVLHFHAHKYFYLHNHISAALLLWQKKHRLSNQGKIVVQTAKNMAE